MSGIILVSSLHPYFSFVFFFFNDTATTEIYTLSLHDALPNCGGPPTNVDRFGIATCSYCGTRRSEEHSLNSSHRCISYAVFCLKKKKKKTRKKVRRKKKDTRNRMLTNYTGLGSPVPSTYATAS